MSETHTVGNIVASYNPELATWNNIHNLLEEARKSGREGECAHHLIGASLQMTFPDVAMKNSSYNRASYNMGKPGDFLVGDTAFYVTVSPYIGIFETYRQNLENGYRIYLLVPEKALAGSRQNAELMGMGEHITVQSIESFVGQNMDELSYFKRDKKKNGFRRLLETYNDRVNAAETDKSMLIEIPRNL